MLLFLKKSKIKSLYILTSIGNFCWILYLTFFFCKFPSTLQRIEMWFHSFLNMQISENKLNWKQIEKDQFEMYKLLRIDKFNSTKLLMPIWNVHTIAFASRNCMEPLSMYLLFYKHDFLIQTTTGFSLLSIFNIQYNIAVTQQMIEYLLVKHYCIYNVSRFWVCSCLLLYFTLHIQHSNEIILIGKYPNEVIHMVLITI